MVRRVAVVGAGTSGLVCIKTCLEEGLEPVCFERSDDIAGLWKFREAPAHSTIYRSLVTNTSKEMMSYSDFPIPADYPNYMHNSQLLQYYRLYAEHFDLLKYIHFQTTVRSVTQRPDFSQSGQWDIVTINRDGEEEKHIFDAVMVCSGHFNQPVLPLTDFPGHETFSGSLTHSFDYQDADAYRGKRVVVLGIGNSAGDIAVEISRAAEKTFLSTRQGTWVLGRMGSNGLPIDLNVFTRLNSYLLWLVPSSIINWAAERALNKKFDHRLYGLQPSFRLLDRRPLINDDLPDQVLQGAVVMKPNVKGFTASGVIFEDGTVEENIDAVVFCTGYVTNIPFLPQALSNGPHRDLTLYKRVFPPSLSKPTLAAMSLFLGTGPVMPVVEMQARWAVKVFTGRCHLPSEEKMLEVIESDMERNVKSLTCRRQASLFVDYMSYVDFMAEQIGARPNLLRLLLTDPVLWVKVFCGPCTPYQYRLTGPGQWTGARQAILSQWERVAQPFRTRVVPQPESKSSFLFSPWMLIFGGGTVITAMLLSKNEFVQVPQGAAHILDRCKIFLSHSWFTGLP